MAIPTGIHNQIVQAIQAAARGTKSKAAANKARELGLNEHQVKLIVQAVQAAPEGSKDTAASNVMNRIDYTAPTAPTAPNNLTAWEQLMQEWEPKGGIDAYLRDTDARKQVDVFSSSAAGKRAVDIYGYENLVKAQLGIEGYSQLWSEAKYFEGLDPIMSQYLGRPASRDDVTSLMKTYATPADYGAYLGYGKAAQNKFAEIGTEDLSNWGAGGIDAASLQAEYWQTGGVGGDLQRRIEEARVRRKNAFTGAQSQAYGSQTEGGLFKQNLF